MPGIFSRLNILEPYSVQEVSEGEIKLDAQENPYELDSGLRKKIDAAVRATSLNRYPDPSYRRLRELISDYAGTGPENILTGNGSDELILSILTAAGPGVRVVAPEPTFSMYRILSEVAGLSYSAVPLERDFSLPAEELKKAGAGIIFLAYPNNPTGNCFEEKAILELLDNPETVVVIDEAYYEFSGRTFAGKIDSYDNLIILRTFSKAFSLAGIRAGYLLASPGTASMLRKAQLPYNISIINQRILETVMEEPEKAVSTVKMLNDSREKMIRALREMPGIEPYESEANFILMKLDNVSSAVNGLRREKIAVREFSSDILKGYLRVTVGTVKENEIFLRAMRKAAYI